MRAARDGLPPRLAEARAYFAAFLGPQAAEQAVADLAQDVGDPPERPRREVLADARAILAARVDPPRHLEALVLRDVGLDLAEISEVMGVEPTEARECVDRALVELGEPPRFSEPSEGRVVIVADDEEDLPRGFPTVAADAGGTRARRTLLLAGVLAVVIVLTLLAWAVTGDAAAPSQIIPPRS